MKCRDREEKYPQKLNIYLVLFIIIDYLYTYIGIHWFNIIEEANPLMVEFFNLPFNISFPMRLLFAALILLLSIYIQKEYEHYKQYIYLGLIVNIGVMLNHFRWVYHLFKSYS